MARPARPGAYAELLDAARAEFSLHGLARARVEDIARRAGISKGAFYLHFRTKEDAFHAIVERFLGAMEDQLGRRQEAEERFTREHAGAVGVGSAELIDFECAVDTETLESLWRHRDLLAAVDSAGDARTLRLMGDFRRRLHALTTARMAEKQAQGRIRPDVDPEVVADVILGTYEDFARRMGDMQQKPDLAAWTRSFLLVVYEGMLPRPAAPAERDPRAPRRPRARV
jgi:AcrR family transcriptional regulator